MWRGMNVSFRDMLFLLVFAYLVIGAVALAHVRKQQQETSGATPPGSVIVELHWDDKIDADVDLWVQAPGDVPVGYSNKSGVVFNLLRDDLGHSGDPLSMNYEIAYGRGIFAGEYTVNAHLYRSADHRFPIPVHATVSVHDPQDHVRRILESTAELKFQGQEITIFRFKLEKDGSLVAGSLNRIHKPLRSAQVSPGVETVTPFILAFLSLALVLGIYAFVGLPFGSRWQRIALSAGFALLLAGLFFGYSDMLGRPKSTRLEVLRQPGSELKVLGSYIVEGAGIYLWLQLPDLREPRYYVLPWDEKTAKALQTAIQENAQAHGGGVMMQIPVERSWEWRDPVFHPAPQPKLPDKGGAPPPVLYQAPEQDI